MMVCLTTTMMSLVLVNGKHLACRWRACISVLVRVGVDA
jgi:hypothetical protein